MPPPDFSHPSIHPSVNNSQQFTQSPTHPSIYLSIIIVVVAIITIPREFYLQVYCIASLPESQPFIIIIINIIYRPQPDNSITNPLTHPPSYFSLPHSREQQLLNVFEVVVSTLEGKLQRIDNLDKAVEHLMRRVEQLDSRVADNIVKNDAVINKLMALDARLAYEQSSSAADQAAPLNIRTSTRYSTSSTSSNNNNNNGNQNMLNHRLLSLDQKVTDIDSKLEVLKNQIDTNFLPLDDFTAEASEKKPVSMNVIEITKSMNAEVINYVSKGLGQIRTNTENIDKKLQFHINIVSENLGKMVRQLNDVHEAIVDQQEQPQHTYPLNGTSTTTARPLVKSSKIDILFKQMRPIMTVSEKMDEVWDVVVGTKSSVDDLVPKSDELLTNTQRQERAIGEIHSDLRSKTNQIIENLDMVERRLKKQEDDVAVLAQRPVSPDLLMDPTIDRLVEYDPNRCVKVTAIKPFAIV